LDFPLTNNEEDIYTGLFLE